MATQAEVSSIQAQIDQVQYQISKRNSTIAQIQNDIKQATVSGDMALANSQRSTLARQQELLAEDQAAAADLRQQLNTAQSNLTADSVGSPQTSAGETTAQTPTSPSIVTPTNADPAVTEGTQQGSAPSPSTLSSETQLQQMQGETPPYLPSDQAGANPNRNRAPSDSTVVFVYRAIEVVSTFSKGKFTQELVGTIVNYPDIPTTQQTQQTSTATSDVDKTTQRPALVPPVTINGVPITNSILNQPLAGNGYVTSTQATTSYYNKLFGQGALQKPTVSSPTSNGSIMTAPSENIPVESARLSTGKITPMTPENIAKSQNIVKDD